MTIRTAPIAIPPGTRITSVALESRRQAILELQGGQKPPLQQSGGTVSPGPKEKPTDPPTPVAPSFDAAAALIDFSTEEVEIPIYSLNEDETPNTDDQIGVATASRLTAVVWRLYRSTFHPDLTGTIDIAFEMPGDE